MRAKDVMNKEPYILYSDDTILNASKFMEKERVRNLPVVDKDNKLIGLITLREIIEGFAQKTEKALLKQKDISSNSHPLIGIRLFIPMIYKVYAFV